MMSKEEIRKLAEEIVKQVNIEPSDLDAIEATEEILIGYRINRFDRILKTKMNPLNWKRC